MAESYVVDDDGDLIITHRASSGPFAPWDRSEGLSDIRDGEPDVKTIENPCAGHDGSSGSTPLISPLPPPELQFKVSSKHMAVASPRFKKMLAGPYKEANLPCPDSCRQVIIEEFDSEALKIVLDIIHGKNSKVSRSLSLEMVAKVSEWVDDLECLEQVEVFGDIWIHRLEKSLPEKTGRDLILWILISFVFRKSGLFKSATRTAILHNTGPFMTLELPIRPTIAERINRQRLELLEQLITNIHGVVDGLCVGDNRCTFECESMTLGALLKQIRPLGLWPRPSEPDIEFSFVEIARTLRSLRSPRSETYLHLPVAEEDSGASWSSSYSKKMSKKGGRAKPSVSWNTEIEAEADWGHECNLKRLLVPDIDRLGHSVIGLNLEDIPSSGIFLDR